MFSDLLHINVWHIESSFYFSNAGYQILSKSVFNTPKLQRNSLRCIDHRQRKNRENSLKKINQLQSVNILLHIIFLCIDYANIDCAIKGFQHRLALSTSTCIHLSKYQRLPASTSVRFIIHACSATFSDDISIRDSLGILSMQKQRSTFVPDIPETCFMLHYFTLSQNIAELLSSFFFIFFLLIICHILFQIVVLYDYDLVLFVMSMYCYILAF